MYWRCSNTRLQHDIGPEFELLNGWFAVFGTLFYQLLCPKKMFALIFSQVIGHGLMLDPVSRNAKHGINTLGGSMWFRYATAPSCSDTSSRKFHNNFLEMVIEERETRWILS